MPPGYRAQVLSRWGDPLGVDIGAPEFRMDAGNSAAEQALQAGMHHDAIELFPLPSGNALLAVNYEYTDDGLLHPDGMQTWSADKVRKSQAAHGVGILEIALQGRRLGGRAALKYARRITAYTPMRISGPAAGSRARRPAKCSAPSTTAAAAARRGAPTSPARRTSTATSSTPGSIPPEQRRYGISARGARLPLARVRPRASTPARNPNEPNKFGWVVEIDPYDPQAQPVKRTALGRFKHEGAMVTLAADGRVVVYMGDDERFEYIYKFVSKRAYDRGEPRREPRSARRGHAVRRRSSAPAATASGSPCRRRSLRRWSNHARLAADKVGATKMDRPEWIAVHPVTQDVYVTLTNNDRRGGRRPAGVDAANPRAQNVYGHILKWREQGGDPAAPKFRWEARSPSAARRKGFGSPDGLWFDPRGVLWIQTDVSTSALNRGPYAKLGNNQMLAADIATGEIRRFLTGPAGCEVTGVTMAPDGRTMFVNIQHPGEPASERSNPDAPRAVSNWPDQRPDGRPRAATVAIRREDGGLIGT